MATRTETALKNRHYNQLLLKLNETLPSIRDQCLRLTSYNLQETHPKELLAQLDVLCSDVTYHEKYVKDLKASGEELMSILEELDCKETPKAKEIQQNLEDVHNCFANLTALIKEKRTFLEQLCAQYEATESELNSLLVWIQETQVVFKPRDDTSLDLTILNEQVNSHCKLLSDVLTHEHRFNLVVEQCRSLGICNKVSELVERFGDLRTQVKARDQKLQSILTKLSGIKTNSEQITDWISNASSLLTQRIKNGMLHLQTSMDTLCCERMEMEKSLEWVRKTGKELIADSSCCDSTCLRDLLAHLQSFWRQLADQMISVMSSMLKKNVEEFTSFVTETERRFGQTETIPSDPKEASVRIQHLKKSCEELSSKQDELNQLINRFDHMLEDQLPVESHAELTSSLASLQKRMDALSKLMEKRIAMLHEALPLVSHLHQTYSDFDASLVEVQNDIDSLDVTSTESVEVIKVNQYNLKVTEKVVEDYQPTVDDVASLGHELKSLCQDCDCSQITELVICMADKYQLLKKALKGKLISQEETFKRAFTDVNDTLTDLLSKAQNLSDRVTFADNIAANIFVLNQQLTENKDILTELNHLKIAINETNARVENLTQSDLEGDDDGGKRAEIHPKMEHLTALHAAAEAAAQKRTDMILEVLGAAEKFFFDFLAISETLHELRHRLASQEPLGLEPEVVRQQKADLMIIQDDLERTNQQMEHCLQTSAPSLEALGASDADREIKKCSDDFDDLQDEIMDGIRTRLAELDEALEIAENFASYSKSIMTWLPEAELKLRSMAPIAESSRSVRIQIEEFKVFKVQMYPRHSDIHRLNQFLEEMTSASPNTVHTVAAHVKGINTRWQELVRTTNQREENLRHALIELGEIDHAIEDVMGLLQQIETDLLHFNEVYGDPRYLEIHLKKVEVLLKDIAGQKGIIHELDETIETVLRRSGRRISPLADRKHEMMNLFNEIQANARDRRDELLDRLKEVKGFVRSIDEIIRWLNNFKWQLKLSRPMGALLDTVHTQYQKTTMAYEELEMKEMEVTAILLNGEDMFCRCQQQEGKGLRQKLNQLQVLMYDTKAKAKLIKKKMEDHIKKVEKFHGELSMQTKWLTDLEKRLKHFRHPSKLVEKVQLQMQQLQECETDIKARAEPMKAVDKDGTYLKYFGSKQDTIYIKNLLMSVRMRWKKLLQTSDEARRILEHACRENKRFFESWKALCDWLSETERDLLYHNYMICSGPRTKQEMDELKRVDLQMSAKQPLYCVTRRLGTSMRDRCAKSDPERPVLSDMLEELSSKWNQLKSNVLQRQEKVDDCLQLIPGSYSDTIEAMLKWLKKSEVYLSDRQMILGDVSTVTFLMEQHKEFQQELLRRMEIIQKIPDIPLDSSELSGLLEKVKTLCTQIHRMSDLRQGSLHEALKLAEDFNEALEDIHSWLPVVEAELKFRSIPNDEDGIIRLIENHEKFQEDLFGQEPNIEKMIYLAEEILVSCHPNATSIIKYHMTIMQTRWLQAMRRSKSRAEQLQMALRDVQRNATLEEELSAWLADAEKRLMDREKEVLPSDQAAIEALLKEQAEFHQTLCSRSRDIEKLKKLSTMGGSNESNKNCNNRIKGIAAQRDASLSNDPCADFKRKWQNLWQASSDRKKILQEMVDQVKQEERSNSFDFDQWRMNAQEWFRSRKLRISDIFRHQDKTCKGVLTKKQFIESLVTAKFPSTSADLRTVFDILDSSCTGTLNYRDFVKAVLSDYQQNIPCREIPQINESDLIREEIRQQTSRCQCLIPFVVQRIDDNKYKFGEKGKLCLVRFVNSSITVRVGGGWMTIGEFMDNFDPCRVKLRPASRGGLATPPERSFYGRGGQATPPESSLATVSELPTLTSGKGIPLNRSQPRVYRFRTTLRNSLSNPHQDVKTHPDPATRSDKSITVGNGARPKGSAVRQAAGGVPVNPNSLKVSPSTATVTSPTSRRKCFQDNRKQHNSFQ